jgi:hypothetical protein
MYGQFHITSFGVVARLHYQMVALATWLYSDEMSKDRRQQDRKYARNFKDAKRETQNDKQLHYTFQHYFLAEDCIRTFWMKNDTLRLIFPSRRKQDRVNIFLGPTQK